MQQPKDKLTFQEKKNIATWLMMLPALSVIVFIRRSIGFRLLDSGWYLGVALLVYLISVFNYDAGRPLPHAMEWYALGIVIFGAWHRMVAWSQLRKGTQPHSYSSGSSIFETRKTPRFLRENQLVTRLVDPALVFLCGVVVHSSLSPVFGNWLFIAGASLLICEAMIYRRQISRELDMADGLMTADVQANVAKRFEPSITANESPVGDSGAVSTGLGDDLRAAIKARQKNG